MKRALAVFAASLAAVAAAPAPVAPGPNAAAGEQADSGLVWKSVKVPGYGAFRLHVPPDWEALAFGTPPDPVQVSLYTRADKEKTTEIQLTIQVPRAGSWRPSQPSVRADVGNVRDLMLPSAKTETLTINELKGRSMTTWYFSMTDRREAPSGGWRYMTYGSGLLEGFVLSFTLSNSRDGAHRLVPTLVMMRDMEWERPTLEEQAEIVRKAEAQIKRWEPVERSKVAGNLDLSIGLPDKDWDVWIDLHDYKVDRKNVAPDRRSAVLEASHPGTRVGLSAQVVRVGDIGQRETSVTCMQLLGDRTNIPYTRIGTSHGERDGMHVLQFDIESFEGAPVQRGADAYLYRDGTCINVHIAKSDFRPQDQSSFNLVLDNIKFVTKK